MAQLRYDEDISKNKLFIKLKLDNKILLETAALEKWIICLPRNVSLQCADICHADFVLSHILVPNEDLPGFSFTTLIGENYNVSDDILTSRTNNDKREILFEEFFYTEKFFKIRCWCISFPLTASCVSNFSIESIATPEDAARFLARETGSSVILMVINNFCMKEVDHLRNENCSVQVVVLTVKRIIDKCINSLMSRKSLREKVNSDTQLSHNLKNAVALSVFKNTYADVFEAISSTCWEKSELFNRALQRVRTVSAEELRIPSKYHPFLSSIKQLFSIGSYKNPLGKLLCIKKTVDFLQIQNTAPLIDEIIPILVYLIVKSDYPNWIPTSVYIREFLQFFEGCNGNAYENFLITTLEAALYFVITEKSYSLRRSNTIVLKDKAKSKVIFLKNLFKLIEMNDEIGVLKLFNVKISNEKEICDIILDIRSYISFDGCENLCHPLCYCVKCRVKISDSYPDVNSRDDDGRTGLHVAAVSGFSRMASILISLGSDVNGYDNIGCTPLHCAAKEGHQNILLLLLNSNADIESNTLDGSTALHLATINGHSGCCKGLLYFSDHIKSKHNIDKEDGQGNTALCIAVKWGYFEIVEVLLEYGANINVTDNYKYPLHELTHDVRIKLLIRGFTKKIFLSDCKPSTSVDVQGTQHIFSAIRNNDVKLACFYIGIHSKDCGSNIYDLQDRINNMRNEEDLSLLQFAVKLNRVEIIETLLENGAKTDIVNKYGQTALHLACMCNNFRATSTLLQYSSANLVDVLDNEGNMAIHYCMISGAFEIAQMILRQYPDLELTNKKNLRAFDLAGKNTG